MRDRQRAASCLALALCLGIGAPAAAQSLRDRIVAAEDARVATDAAMAPILEGLGSDDPSLVALAARAVGRLERPALVPRLLPLLAHDRAEVRREVVNALGQSLAAVPRTEGTPVPEVARVAQALIDRLTDDDPYVRGTIGETLGRLPYRDEATARRAEEALQELMPTLHPGSLTGTIKGVEAWLRYNQARYAPAARTLERLRATATLEVFRLDPAFAFVRRVAWLGVNAARAGDLALVQEGVRDPDLQVRRLAVLGLANVSASAAERATLLAGALADPSFNVRYEAVRVYGRLLQAATCRPLIAALADDNPHVRLAAIDALANPCPSGPDASGALVMLADRLPPASAADAPMWHEPAHALVSLATAAPAAAAERLPRFAQHPSWDVRVYAARAATALADRAALDRLAADASDNVRNEAVLGLRKVAGHAADALFVEALGRPDYQLILSAAQALEGSPNASTAVPALLRAFARVTLERKETSRDARLAILVRLRELGTAGDAAALVPCLSDFDPVVAGECAATLQAWTGIAHTPRPRPMRPPPPGDDRPSRARVVMADGTAFDVALFPDDAPATVARFADLARRGYYDGLTFHRVVPNFVVQGGSPGANEYAGDGPFMRDELSLRSHARGTLGISTRGRDTGDAQFFINLLDNPRLDHDFTVFGEVTGGMDVVDGILEGAMIGRIDVP